MAKQQKSRSYNRYDDLMDRLLPPEKMPPFLRPKGWVPPEDRIEADPTPAPAEPRPAAKRGTPRGTPATNGKVAKGAANVVYVGPPEVSVKHGSVGRRIVLIALGIAFAVLVGRGVQGMVTGNPKPHITINPVITGSWPDPAADAFAVRFASAYFSASPGGGAGAATARSLMTSDLQSQIAQATTPVGLKVTQAQTVIGAVVTGDTKLDTNHALIDVAVTTQSGNAQQYLDYTIPVYRHGAGLAVYALPAPVPSPPEVPTGDGSLNTVNVGDAAVQTLVQRFFEAWTTNDTTQLSYLSTPGATFLPLPSGLSFKQVQAVTQVCPQNAATCGLDSSHRMTIDATVTLQNTVTSSTVTADYYMRLSQDSAGNWYVHEVTTGA